MYIHTYYLAICKGGLGVWQAAELMIIMCILYMSYMTWLVYNNTPYDKSSHSHVTYHCNTLQHTATHCNTQVISHMKTPYDKSSHMTVRWLVRWLVIGCLHMWDDLCVAVCCSVLQCVAVCYSDVWHGCEVTFHRVSSNMTCPTWLIHLSWLVSSIGAVSLYMHTPIYRYIDTYVWQAAELMIIMCILYMSYMTWLVYNMTWLVYNMTSNMTCPTWLIHLSWLVSSIGAVSLYMHTPIYRYIDTYVWQAAKLMIIMCCSVLQCVAVCCNVLQCVAVCCRWQAAKLMIISYSEYNIYMYTRTYLCIHTHITSPFAERARVCEEPQVVDLMPLPCRSRIARGKRFLLLCIMYL